MISLIGLTFFGPKGTETPRNLKGNTAAKWRARRAHTHEKKKKKSHVGKYWTYDVSEPSMSTEESIRRTEGSF